MWELDHKHGWGLKNWCFWTVAFEKTTQESFWTARRSNQSILTEISPGCSLEGLMLKLKLQYSGHLMRRKDRDAGKDWRQEKGMTRIRWLDGITNSMDMSLSKLSERWWRTGKPGVLKSMGSQRVGQNWATEQQTKDSKLFYKESPWW